MSIKLIDLSEYLPKPNITSRSKNYAINGEPFKLDCYFELMTSSPFSLKFILPNGNEAISNENMTLALLDKSTDEEFLYISLTVHNPHDKEDEGNYTCYVEDKFNNSNFGVKTIKFIAEPFIQFNSTCSKVTKKFIESSSTEFKFNYSGCPDIELEYFKDGELIGNEISICTLKEKKYEIKINEEEIIFTIMNPTVEDRGNYTFVASNKAGTIKKNIEFIVEGKNINLDIPQ